MSSFVRDRGAESAFDQAGGGAESAFCRGKRISACVLSGRVYQHLGFFLPYFRAESLDKFALIVG